jgi:hypothetical protein
MNGSISPQTGLLLDLDDPRRPSASMSEAPGLSSTAEVVVAMPTEGFLTPARLAGLLGVSVRTLQRWDAARIGPPRCKNGNLVLYAATSVHGWLDAAERPPAGRKPGGRRSR